MFVFFNDIDGTISRYTFKSKWIQSDMNVHTIDVIFNREFDNTQYNCYIQFLREGESKPSPKLLMTPEIITYGEGTYRGYTFKATTEWYTAIAGTLKASIEIKQYEETGLETNKAYGIVNIPIEQSLSDSPEVESTITKEEYDSFMAVLNAKLNIDDEKVYSFETDFNTRYLFALECIKHKIANTTHKLYIGKVQGLLYFGIVDKNGTKVTIVNGNGEIYLTNGKEDLSVTIDNLANDVLESTTATIETLTVRSLDASEGFVTVATPSANNNPTTRKYVDDIKTELQDKIDGIEAAQNLLDIVGTYKTGDDNLLGYPTINLKKNDKIKVLQDENYGNAGTYYKWNGQTWVYIGKDGIYYTQTEVDNRINILKAQIESLRALVTTLTASNVSYKED